MLKTLCAFLLAILSVCIFADTYTLSNDNISVEITTEGNTAYFSSIINKRTNTENIEKSTGEVRNMWYFQAKVADQFASEPIDMFPKDAEKLSVSSSPNKIVLTWKNVKKADWNKGFDVIVTGELGKVTPLNNDISHYNPISDTLWDIKIISHTKDYAIWLINFPNIIVHFATGDEFFSGLGGGYIEKENIPGDRPNLKTYHNLEWVPYPVGDMPMQLMYSTQKGSGVYLCPEDTEGWHKHFKYRSLTDKAVDYSLELHPNDQGVGGVSFNQAYKFNISAFDGDWFDAVKTYRAWGIKAGAAPFKKGPIQYRKDFPEWVKKNVFWGNDYQTYIAGGVPSAFHLYSWWNWPHDEGYPEMLPAKMTSLQPWLDRFEKAHQNFIFYTNCHLIDTEVSELYKKYGDEICNLTEDGTIQKYHWAHGQNSATCPNMPQLKEIAVNLNKFLVSEYGSDGVYLDELTMLEPEPCFNKKHGHTLGTGNRPVKAYSDIMEAIHQECSKVADKPIIIFSEGTAEPFPCDMELDLQANADRPYGKAAYYSGYRIIWGMQYNPYDFEPSEQPGIAKMAYTLIGGWQLGWYENLPTGKDYKDFPDFTAYQKGACLARNYAIDYFSLGEFVRAVKITSDIPYVDTPVELIPNEKTELQHVPGVQTSSWNLNGKTMIVFTNITKEPELVAWESTAHDLYLEKDRLYTISEGYPEKKAMGKGFNIFKSAFTIKPLETVIIIVE